MRPCDASSHCKSMQPTFDFIRAVERDIRSKSLFSPGSSILVAVSGGPDSVCLLHVLLELQRHWDLRLAVAHFDHGLRAEESKRDADFVASLAGAKGLSFYLGSGDVKGFSRSRAGGGALSIQDAARHLRYNFLLKTLKEIGFDYLATAHNAQDQAEELLFRFLRGSSMQGLCGIPWKRVDGVIRPLLGRTREEILSYLKAASIEYVIDSSNLTLKYERNRIRQQLFPILVREYNPNLIHTLCRIAEMLREDEMVLTGMAEEVFERAASVESARITLQLEIIRQYPIAIRKRVYRMALSQLTGGRILAMLVSKHLYALDGVVMGQGNPNASLNLPNGVMAKREYEILHLLGGTTGRRSESDEVCPTGVQETTCSVNGAGTWHLPGSLWGVNISFHDPASAARLWMLLDYSPYEYMSGKGSRVGFTARVLWLNGDRIAFPIGLRTRRPGDRFVPFGHSHPMKLKDFLIARKVPQELRDRLPLLVSVSGEIIAIAGLEIAEPFKVQEDTQRIIRLALQGEQSN